jgi:hypothetical protein
MPNVLVFSAIVPKKLVLMAPTVASMVEAGTMLEVELRASMTAAMAAVVLSVYMAFLVLSVYAM